jgi:predicted component of type VI protein secretion system
MTDLILEWKETETVQAFPLPKDRPITLGRNNCDITLAEQTISRQHASIVPKDDRYYVHNLSRVNAVKINDDIRLSQGQSAPIQAGDVIRLGSIYIRVLEINEKQAGLLKIQCSNCGRANDYKPEGQCIYCGRNLASGDTIMVEG